MVGMLWLVKVCCLVDCLLCLCWVFMLVVVVIVLMLVFVFGLFW